MAKQIRLQKNWGSFELPIRNGLAHHPVLTKDYDVNLNGFPP